ncbi:hypothetical protein FXN63_20335 [Pigmentiphaga aceris]|uniref:TIGR03016 family PEP-CTERM system-associated outer membrane protein n=1 Tax=Pigmentiphaga aceris TaxID=1940612 RepID=A0A5C0B1R0_9BURK|nr:hypothetical protein [Pigmentiphaga aceris]QEI07926.1 hypothetical protein FXN63_20335 [Pigmentiphaga aceris]
MSLPVNRAARTLISSGVVAVCLGMSCQVASAQGVLSPRLLGDPPEDDLPVRVTAPPRADSFRAVDTGAVPSARDGARSPAQADVGSQVYTEPLVIDAPPVTLREVEVSTPPQSDPVPAAPQAVSIYDTLSPQLMDYVPTAIQYVLEVEPGVQWQSNPFRFSDAEAAQRESDIIRQLSLRAGVVVPLGSDRTRLELSGVRTESRYSTFKQLDNAANHLEAALRWQAGDLFVGSVATTSDDSLYRYLNRTAPSRDMVHTDTQSADVGLRITDDLTLPILRVSNETTRHDFGLNRMRFNQDLDRVQVAGRYTGWRQSAISAGLSKADGNFLDRTDELAALVGRRYRDTEAFLDWTWDYSMRTTLAGRVSYLQRRYPGLVGRDSNLPTAFVRMGWEYSAKTRFDAIVWRLPYPNSEDPTILYTTSTGGQVSAAWKASEKLWASATLAAERVGNTRFTGSTSEEDSQVYRAGVRVEWELTRGAVLALDAWRDRTIAPAALDSFSNNVVRLNLLLTTDNGLGRPQRLLWHPECLAPRSIQTSSCQTQ